MENDTRPAESPDRRAKLEEVEHDGRPPFILTGTELKLLGIAGVGFFLDGEQLHAVFR